MLVFFELQFALFDDFLLFGVLTVFNLFEGHVPICALLIFLNFDFGVFIDAKAFLCRRLNLDAFNTGLLNQLPCLCHLHFKVNAFVFSGIFLDFGLNQSSKLGVPEHVDDGTIKSNSVAVVQYT